MYDATGRKWSQAGPEGIREYIGGIEYLDQEIQSVQHGEGRLVATYSGTSIESIRAEYWRQDHLGNTRVAFSDFNLDGVIATKDDPNTTENEVEITQENHYYPFGLNHEGPWYEIVQPKNKYQYNGKENIEDLGLNWMNYGARYYDQTIGRFTGVDPKADQFAWVTTYNYAENEPVSNIDLWGLQKFYAPGGKFLGKYGDSDEERIVNKPSNIRKVEKVLSLGDSYQKESFMTEFLSKGFSNRLLRSEDLNAEYDKFALRYKDNGEYEYAMAIYEGNFTDEEGNSFKGYQLGSVVKENVKSKYGGASVVISDSTIPIYETGFWSIHSAIHTHPRGNVDNFSGIDKQDNGGPRFGFGVTNDLGWSIQSNANVLLAVPSSNQIATFNPSLYNQYMAETGANKYTPSERNAQIKRAISLRTIGKK